MKKTISGKQIEQIGFDFGFNATVDAIDRIAHDAITDGDDLLIGEKNAGRTNEGTGTGSTGAATVNAESSIEGTVYAAGLENTGPLGTELAADLAGDGSAGRDSAAEPLAEPTGVGESGSVGTDRSDERGPNGTRNIADESRTDRTGVKAKNYVITEQDKLGEGGQKAKYRDNIAALSLLKTLEKETRMATPEEQAVLVKYVGWGGIPQAFDHRNTDWRSEYVELSRLLPKEEYEAARRSTQDAHYTAKPVVEAIYSGLERLGVNGGRFLEPAMGSGNFLGLMPASIRENATVTGIELDHVTASIAKHLYPDATVINKGYQEVAIPSGYFDVAVGNPPFGNQKLFDPLHRELTDFSIHNYFISKTLDKVRNGGVVAVVVSNFFMDAHNGAAREWVADRAHLLGAVRLPNTAFKQNALTEVTTDIVFLQKAKEGEIPSRAWVEVGTIQDEATQRDIPLNQYFIDHPDMMLGKMALTGTMYRDDSPTLVASPGEDIATGLARAIAQLPEGVFTQAQAVEEVAKQDVEVPENVKVGAFFMAGNRVARRLPDLLDSTNFEYVETKNDKQTDRIKGMIGVRTALRELMTAERTEAKGNAEVEALRARLNTVYDGFVKKHGFISALSNRQAMKDDPDYPLLHSLERDYDKGISADIAKRDGVQPREASAKKATIFSTRVLTPHREITQAASAKDGMIVSLNELGRVDLPYIVRLTGLSEEQAISDLKGLIYSNPSTKAWESADQYLTGNVKAKLKIARGAAQQDERYRSNAEALELVQPKDIEPIDIGVQLGSTWVPEDVVGDFVTHLLGNVHQRISYQPTLGKWMVNIGRADQTTNCVTWGTAETPANSLIESILTNKAIQVKEIVGRDDYNNPIYEVNEEKTAVSNQKADEIRQAFLDWVWEDKTRRERLATIYNDTFNTNVAPIYDGSHLTLPGASVDVQLRSHQKDAIWRGIQDGTALLDHVVGAGKTYEMIGIAMESRRMGLLNKPMIAVPNHLTLQWKDAFYKLYPEANVLVAEKSDFTKENRQKLFAKIATGDWDAVIVGHSSLKKIGMPPQTLDDILSEQIDDLTEALRRLKEEKGDRVTIKNMEKARDRMKAKMEKAANAGTKDRVVSFDELGVDALMVDESHEFKNLFISTSLNRVSGLGNLAGSDKAFDLFVKARYLQNKQGGRGLFFGTGTPISNTIAEMYTVQRYMQYDAMKERGIEHFDSWASTFGRVVTGWELDSTGMNYKLNSRFAKFQNMPELTAQYRTFADVITMSDLKRQAQEQGTRFPVPKVKGGKPTNVIVPRSALQAKYIGEQQPLLDEEGKPRLRGDGTIIKEWTPGSIIARMENPPKDPRIDNPLKITNDARKAGLDYRLIDPSAPDDPGSKVNVAVENIVRIHKAWEAKKGTQLVFCDLSTPKMKGTEKKEKEKPAVDTDNELEDDEDDVSISMDELLAGDSKFSVYDDIKQKLIAAGIPENEIRFIHEAKTDLQKAKLFEQVNAGNVRIMIGSTAKMGAGTNVQQKLVAEHHVDCPWRPSDLEQREGRIIRQGNEFYEADPDNFEVELMRYSTEKTYDARMWQTIEYKAAGIEQFRKGDSLQRTIDDIAGEAANAAEMKAAASGNPLIFMQVQLSSDLKKLEAMHSNYKRNLHAIERNIGWLEGSETRGMKALAELQKQIARRDANTTEKWQFISGQRAYTVENKDDLLDIVMSCMQGAIETQAKTHYDPIRPLPVGKYRGFDIEVHAMKGEIMFTLTGEKAMTPANLVYDRKDKFSLGGFIQRLDNCLLQFEYDIEDTNRRMAEDKIALAKAIAEKAKPFKETARLEQLRKDNSEILVELKKMQNDDSYISLWKPSSDSQAVEQAADVDAPEVNQVISSAQKIAAVEAPATVQAPAAVETAPVVDVPVEVAPKVYDAHAIKNASSAVMQYLKVAANPAMANAVLGSRFHDRLFEEGNGTEVLELVVQRISESPELAAAVLVPQSRRFAAPAMIAQAEKTQAIYKDAEKLLEQFNLKPQVPNEQVGHYTGKIVALTDHFVVQDIGKQMASLHRRRHVSNGESIEVGQVMQFGYKGGAVTVKSRATEPSLGMDR